MAAYSALISLLQTLDQCNIPQLIDDHTAETLDSLHAIAKYFQHVLEIISKSSGLEPEKIKSLEEKIRVAATEAEDDVGTQIYRIMENPIWIFGNLPKLNLLNVVEKMDATNKQVMEMEILSHENLELSGDSSIATSSTSHPTLADVIVHGLDDDLEIIVKRLTRPERALDVVAISGMGGIGKTTLARKAYDHPAIRCHFDILVWVTISREFRHKSVLLEALNCISKQTDSVNKKDRDESELADDSVNKKDGEESELADDSVNKKDGEESKLADLVQKSLKGRRYLVVVDDIWSRDVWDSIRLVFPDNNKGSRILLTTRETEVAMYANTCSPHHEMRLLSLENGWRLLCDKVFVPPELEEVGKEIVEKCQGLPLTISVIAGHLSKVASTLQGWKDVARNLSEIIARHPDKCLGVLGLSYRHLPNWLKPCFLSLSSFPEDFQIDARTLILLWIAEGFIRTSGNGEGLEVVGKDYLEDLISRNLIQARKRRFNGEIKECGIHDLLREFCLMEAEMTKYVRIVKKRTRPTQKYNVRRFSFQTNSYSVDDCFKLLPPVARSVYLFTARLYIPQKFIKHEFFPRFNLLFKVLAFSGLNLLKVLAIFNTDVQFKSFPPVITKLFHLRYLQVHFRGDIPESISDLQNLQTLICNGGGSLPLTIWWMKNLRYIRMKSSSRLRSPITEFVEGMPNLEEFSVLRYMSCTNEVFSFIPNLKRLIIELPIYENHSPDRLLDMSRLRKLEAFKLLGSEFLVDPIKRVVFSTSLRRLSLRRCHNFDWADISSTATMLPNLEELKLKDCQASSDEWRLSDEDHKFESLKKLLLSGANLKCWVASSDHFPNLKRLVLKECRYLNEIPEVFGEICTLESIELHDCSTTAEDSAGNIEREQEDVGNYFFKVYIHNRRR